MASCCPVALLQPIALLKSAAWLKFIKLGELVPLLKSVAEPVILLDSCALLALWESVALLAWPDPYALLALLKSSTLLDCVALRKPGTLLAWMKSDA